eukprot:5577875-Pleurochrysis_carterae.AAC.6
MPRHHLATLACHSSPVKLSRLTESVTSCSVVLFECAHSAQVETRTRTHERAHAHSHTRKRALKRAAPMLRQGCVPYPPRACVPSAPFLSIAGRASARRSIRLGGRDEAAGQVLARRVPARRVPARRVQGWFAA